MVDRHKPDRHHADQPFGRDGAQAHGRPLDGPGCGVPLQPGDGHPLAAVGQGADGAFRPERGPDIGEAVGAKAWKTVARPEVDPAGCAGKGPDDRRPGLRHQASGADAFGCARRAKGCTNRLPARQPRDSAREDPGW